MRAAVPIPVAPDLFDRVLIVVFLLGVYLGIEARLPGNIPVPGVIAGFAGGLLLLKNMGRITERQLVPLIVVITLYTLSVLAADNHVYLMERFKGLVQLLYSIAIAYGFFLGASRFDRATIARIFLGFCLAIIVGTALENYTAFVNVSDAFRNRFFSSGVYEANLRDLLLYGRVRPKLFTSEPAAMIFMYTVFCFAWYALALNRFKLIGYIALLGVGYFLMRGPTLLLGIGLVPVYKILLESRSGPPHARRINLPRAGAMVVFAGILVAAGALVGSIVFEERLSQIMSGSDASFFGRVIAPPLAAIQVLAVHPIAGAGLTGWESVEHLVQQVYANSSWLAMDFSFRSAAYAVTNYFWIHWIFLGLFWGVLTLAALTFFLRSLGVPSVLFCWTVWAILGQASGGYVDPRTWLTLLMAAAIAVIFEREAKVVYMRQHAMPAWRGPPMRSQPPNLAIARR